MSKTKQFWTLFKFQVMFNPTLLVIPFVLGTPLLFTSYLFGKSYHSDLTSLLRVQNLFFVAFFGAQTLSPEKFRFGATSSAWSSGTEFLLTRAIDRPILYRARAAFLYLLVLLVPIVSLLQACKSPDLKVTEYSLTARQECLKQVPGSALVADPDGSHSLLIAIPRGNLLVAEWYLVQFTVCALAVQVLVLLLDPVKHRAAILYGLILGSIFLPLADLQRLKNGTPQVTERLFFSFASHQALVGVLLVLVFVGGEFWFERRFSQLEQ